MQLESRNWARRWARPGVGRRAKTLASLLAVLAATATSSTAQQAFPLRPITMVVPAAAGGPTDTVARLIAEPMGRTLGQQVVVENVGGAGGTIGVGRVAKAAGDGYTLLVWHIGQSTAPALYDNLRYDVFNDFDPIGRITDVPMTIVGKTSLAAKDIGELMAWLRQKQDQVTYAHAGIGSAAHLCGLMLMSALNIKMNAVVYRGTGPAMNDLVGGQFDMMCDQTTGTANQIKAGTIRGFAATTKTRIPLLAELPTLDEVRGQGLRGCGLARALGTQRAAQGGAGEAHGGPAGSPARTGGDRAHGWIGDGACSSGSRHARGLEGAAGVGGRQMGSRDPGGRGKGQLVAQARERSRLGRRTRALERFAKRRGHRGCGAEGNVETVGRPQRQNDRLIIAVGIEPPIG